ncbi:MAG: UvrD-helicase domain-containing protein [Desulfovibrionaceae bacterium]|nr:UvrD-helicase domain-containing protein [Desulfovibrionaceae bacterium]
MSPSSIRQVKAAAGSGKTFALTARFLELLGAARSDDPGLTCRGLRPETYSWPEILAVTFTNKAAAEMKERVLKALKRCALDLRDDGQRADWDRARAAGVVETILRRYHRLNIRTIDSLLVLLLRLFALEYGIRPDFEVAFEEADVFDLAYERFVGRCENPAGPERTLLLTALDTFLRHENRSGFRPERGIRERLKELTTLLQAEDEPLLTDQDELADLLTACRERFLEAVTLMRGFLDEYALAPDKRFLAFLQKCQAVQGFDEPPKSAYAEKPLLEDCLTKAGKARVTDQCEAAYDLLKTAVAAYRREWAAVSGAYALAPALTIAGLLVEDMRAESRLRGVVPIAALTRAVRDLLGQAEAVPEAYCRLGSRLFHLLVDEFQDTSRAQWTAVAPLAEECLSKGGSLFCVGDVKQAIYGWRGGDASLFDEVPRRPGLADLAERVTAETLPRNWRSTPAVVAFNNDFFTHLAEPDMAGELAGEILGEAPEEERAALAEELARVFADARQDMPDGYGGPEGYVRLTRLPGGTREEFETRTLEALRALILDLVARRPYRDIAVLVRDNRQAGVVCEQLVALDIPVVTESSLLLARHPLVRQLAAFLEFLDFPADDLAFLALVSGPVFQRAAGLAPLRVADWLVERKRGNLGMRFRDAFPEVWERTLKPFFDKAGLLTPYDLAQAAVERFGVFAAEPGAELYVRRFLEVVHLAEERGCRSLSAFLDFWRGQGAEEKVPLPENLDAVQVLTMHKSKGLEFPVAIVPFHDWSLRPQDGLLTIDLRGKRLLTPAREALGPEYRERAGREAREQLHLLYVAWTRAREELYGFFPDAREDKRRPPALAAMTRLLDIPEREAAFERGHPSEGEPQERPKPAPAAPPEPTEPGEELTAWLPRLRVFRHSLEDVFLDQRRRGEMAHRALELLRSTGDDAADANRAARLAVLDFPFVGGGADLEGELADLLLWVLSRPELKDCLGRGLAEAEALDEEGRTLRCDRLVLSGDEALVLEYKTGRPDPEHETQVRRYLKLALALRPKARGLLVYLDRREVREVAHA